MSATELIEQLKALPAHEQAEFARRFGELQTQASKARRRGNGPAVPAGRWEDFSTRLRRIYGDRIVPDSQAVIAYGRGEV
jgi:hypothetical protein